MMSRKLLLLTAALLLAACSSVTTSQSFTRTNYPEMFAALDTSPDGYKGFIKATGETYRIHSTHLNDLRLCRLVEIKSSESFFGESFCKAKGGEWQ